MCDILHSTFPPWREQSQQRGWLPSGICHPELCLIPSTLLAFHLPHVFSCLLYLPPHMLLSHPSILLHDSISLTSGMSLIPFPHFHCSKNCSPFHIRTLFPFLYICNLLYSPPDILQLQYVLVSFGVTRSGVETNLNFIHSITGEFIFKRGEGEEVVSFI